MKDNVYLCQECLTCRNPDIYCKYRSSCPIWYLQKHPDAWNADQEEPSGRATCRVVFKPANKTVTVDHGSTLLKAAQIAGIGLNASCNGKGACGKCKLIVSAGNFETVSSPSLSDPEKANNYVLACLAKVYGDVSAEIPPQVLEEKLDAQPRIPLATFVDDRQPP